MLGHQFGLNEFIKRTNLSSCSALLQRNYAATILCPPPCNVARQHGSNHTSTLRCNYATSQPSARLLQPSCNFAATKCAIWVGEREVEKLIIGGDFNAKIGQEGGDFRIEEKHDVRRSKDKVKNTEGKLLLEMVEERG